MLFSSESPRQRIVTLRAWLEKYSAAWPAELPAPTMWTSCPCVFGGLAARGAVEDALADEAVEALDRSCRQDTPLARMIVRARSTSPPSRCTSRVAGSMR